MAIFSVEPGYERFAEAISLAERRAIPAATWFELAILVDGEKSAIVREDLEDFMERHRVEVVPVTLDQVRLARSAYRRFGKGSGQGAKLNFGDCFAYALAQDRDEPLLFKGNDFPRTDVKHAT